VDANSFLSLIHCVKSCWFRRSEAVQKKKMPFLEVPRRLAVRAVKAAGFAFMGAKRTALTEEAGGLGAGFGRKGSEENDGCAAHHHIACQKN